MSTASGFEVVWHWLLAYGIALARPMAMLALNPVFTRAQITGLLRGAVASALALPMVPVLVMAMQSEPANPIGLMLLAAKEAIIGAALGLLLGAPFWALDVAGDILDAQRGATQGRLNDPAGFEDVSIAGTMLIITGIALFVMTGGLESLADLLYGSWAIWRPLGAFPHVDDRTPVLLLGLLDRITRQGLLVAVPVVLAMLLADAALLLVARMAPQLRIDDLALSVRNIVFFIVMPLYVMFLMTYMRQDFATLPALLDLMRDATTPLGAPTP
ncbi:type III secretion system export apparatus subunit SctT [Lichenihabitans psoromatis]|uniref:type III secretion system export apparatus subunit SctT n=1 Tax=Lichenihabitans psoromatis TaxID=2528642 RepID=UPI0010366277|nr:type III secretion system export apparatus subunit SctT [Lichenihabitans psoromatis]